MRKISKSKVGDVYILHANDKIAWSFIICTRTVLFNATVCI